MGVGVLVRVSVCGGGAVCVFMCVYVPACVSLSCGTCACGDVAVVYGAPRSLVVSRSDLADHAPHKDGAL